MFIENIYEIDFDPEWVARFGKKCLANILDAYRTVMENTTAAIVESHQDYLECSHRF